LKGRRVEELDTLSLAPARADATGPEGPPTPRPGDVFEGKYRIEREIGTGGMGVVLGATHVSLGEPVALKFLRSGAIESEATVARFVREARATARIKSPHVVRILDVGTTSAGVPFIVMEHLEGRDLAALLRDRGAVPVVHAIDWLRQACAAMREAHGMGIVHRDLKPSNLFLTDEGVIKVLDFGIAKVHLGPDAKQTAPPALAKLTSTGAPMGTPLYMSPEQLRSAADVDARTDVWSLGVILHELLSGRSPFEATSAHALCAKIAADPPVPLREHLAGASPELEALVAACLEKDRSRRIDSAVALDRALEALVLAPPDLETARPITLEEPRSAARPARRAVAAIAGVAALGGVLVLGAWLRPVSLFPARQTVPPAFAELTAPPALAGPASHARVAAPEDHPAPSLASAPPRGDPSAVPAPASEPSEPGPALVASQAPRAPRDVPAAARTAPHPAHQAPRPSPTPTTNAVETKPPPPSPPAPPPIDPMGDRL
jgi:serine/threonine-protein kinase